MLILRIKHVLLLIVELARYAVINRRAWPLALLLLLLMAAAFAVATQAASPFIYTLF